MKKSERENYQPIGPWNGFIVARKDIEQFLIYDVDAGFASIILRHMYSASRRGERSERDFNDD